MQENKIKHSILKTLLYSDLFDYPLTDFEIWKYYSGRQEIKRELVSAQLAQMIRRGEIEKKKTYYFLAGRSKLFYIRRDREKISKAKIKIAKRIIKLLAIIPTVRFVGVSGSLSLNNSKINDDIDIFIITRDKTLWLTRFLVNLILVLKKSKRGRDDFYGTDKICPNMFLTEEALIIKKEKQNLFTAREIVQLRIIFNKNKTHQRFLYENSWIKKILPNTKISTHNLAGKRGLSENKMLDIVDKIFYSIQFLYMSNRITEEEVRRDIAKFHPKDKSRIILQAYNLHCKSYLLYLRTKLNHGLTVKALDTPGY